jgi:phosphoribosylformylglycinamidine cyclo-ligase
VDVQKRGVEAFTRILDNAYPHAFCVVTTHKFLPNQGLVLHTDSVGTKPIQSYINWKETDDLDSFKGLAQDVIAMNIDDVICVGATPVSFIDYVALNPFTIPKEGLLTTLSQGFAECLSLLRQWGLDLQFAGGETAELADLIRLMDLSGTALGQVDLADVVSGAAIVEGNVIIGLRSGGKTKLETTVNSGIMCNGITLARHALLRREYSEKYPDTRDARAGPYTGSFRPDQYLDELDMTVGEAITSPTRLFTPIILKVLDEQGSHVTGLLHNTGGGQTKCLRIGENIHYVKTLMDVDPIFPLIQGASGEEWRRMLENYNMGTGFEIVVDVEAAEDVLSISEGFGLDAHVIGRCEKSRGANRLTIHSPWGTFQYPQESRRRPSGGPSVTFPGGGSP